MTLIRRSNSNYTTLRCFDPYKLPSWARGLTEFGDGRNQQSTSEVVNAYYVAALMGLAYGHTHLLAIGSTLTTLEILSGTNVVACERGSVVWWRIWKRKQGSWCLRASLIFLDLSFLVLISFTSYISVFLSLLLYTFIFPAN